MGMKKNEGAPVAPTTAPAPEVSKSTKKGKGNPAFQDFKASGAAARENYSDEEKALEGSKSDKVQYVIALANPARAVKRVEKGENKASYMVVGYRFKALEDMMVPSAPMLSKTNPMECGDVTEVPVKKGQEFDLTLFEMGVMISKIEFGGIFNGGGDEVVMHVTMSAQRNNEPLTVLKRRSAPIKDNITLIADVTEKNGKKSYEVKPEFAEKFGILFTKRKSKAGSASSAVAGESPKDLSAAFRTYLSSKSQKA